jgi:hypothetical protein
METNSKKRLITINRDVVVFAFFLLLSFTLWYLNSLGKEAEADIRLPVRFVNLPKGKEIVGNELPGVSLSMKGPGYSILKLKYQRKKTPVTVDLSKVTYKKVPESKASDYYILSSGLSKSFTIQLRSGCDVVSIKPDTLFITFERSK